MAVSISSPGHNYRLTTVGEPPSICSLLEEGDSTIGSHPEATIVLSTTGVSRQHAEIKIRADKIWLHDLGSKNGTFLNGLRIDHAPIRSGDRLRFGPVSAVIDRVEEDDGRLAIPAGAPTPPHQGISATEETRTVGTLEGADQCNDGNTPDLKYPPGYVIGRSHSANVLHELLRCLTSTRLPLLILGETGVGKELAASTLHLSSPRSKGPFVALNCAAIPAELLEAELFGIEAGVASGVSHREGKIAHADGGTLFLDEIGDMPAPLQAKLLRVLQEMEIEPVGARKTKSINVRVITATNTDLRSKVETGGFRADLYYRIAGATVTVTPLRDRRDDIPPLVEHFLTDTANEMGRPAPGVTVAALRALVDAQWPGNVRQLVHEISRLVQVCPIGQPIDSSMLSEDISSPPTPKVNASTTGSLADQVESLERTLIADALESEGGNRSRTAAALGLSRNGLLKKMKRYEIDR